MVVVLADRCIMKNLDEFTDEEILCIGVSLLFIVGLYGYAIYVFVSP